jgi:hypothetical protein
MRILSLLGLFVDRSTNKRHATSCFGVPCAAANPGRFPTSTLTLCAFAASPPGLTWRINIAVKGPLEEQTAASALGEFSRRSCGRALPPPPPPSLGPIPILRRSRGQHPRCPSSPHAASRPPRPSKWGHRAFRGLMVRRCLRPQPHRRYSRSIWARGMFAKFLATAAEAPRLGLTIPLKWRKERRRQMVGVDWSSGCR